MASAPSDTASSANVFDDDFLYPVPVGGQMPLTTTVAVSDDNDDNNTNSTNNNGDSGSASGGRNEGLRLTNALGGIHALYIEAGLLPRPPRQPNNNSDNNNSKNNNDDNDNNGNDDDEKTAKKGGKKKKNNAVKDYAALQPPAAIKAPWFQYTDRVIPGGLMKMVESVTIPTPKGLQTFSSKRIEQVFDRRYLLEFEPVEVLRQFNYLELDEMRFAFVAMCDLITGGPEAAHGVVTSNSKPNPRHQQHASSSSAAADENPAKLLADAALNSKVFESMWTLQGLAKRDIKKNCAAAAASGGAGDDDDAAGGGADHAARGRKAGTAKGGTGSSGLIRVDASKDRPKAAATQKHMKALLEDQCKVLWPHTPPSKSALFSQVNDPAQPRHKPLYKTTIEFTFLNKRKFEGPWMANKKDADDSAADVALRFLHATGGGGGGKK